MEDIRRMEDETQKELEAVRKLFFKGSDVRASTADLSVQKLRQVVWCPCLCVCVLCVCVWAIAVSTVAP